MNSWFSTIVCYLVLVTLFVTAGCQQKRKQSVDAFARRPDLETSATIPDYASRAMDTTGGRQAWMKTKKIERDCVVTFYQPDGSFYLTEQQYEIYPWSNSIRIAATEPRGNVVCQSSPDKFSIAEGDYRLYSLPPELRARLFAEMILDITMTPVRLLDESVGFAKGSKQVKKEGLWYWPIERTSRGVGLAKPYAKSVFYQEADSSLVNMIWFASEGEKEFFAVRGYDYHRLKKNRAWVPAKIEIFKTDVEGVLQQRLVKIDVK